MAENLSPVAIQDYFINGIPATGAKVFVYAAGTTTKITTYTDSGGGTSQTNPIVMNSRGEPQNTSGSSTGVWVAAGTAYKLVFAPSTDTDPPTNPIWTVDNILVPILAADVVLTFTGGPPTATQWLGGEFMARSVTFPGNFSGSGGVTPKTLPTATFAVSIQKNGSAIGTASCSTLGVWTFTTSGGAAVTYAVGDILDFFGPATPDSTIANFGLTLDGTLN